MGGLKCLKCMKKRAHEALEGTGVRREDSDGPQIESSIKRSKATLASKSAPKARKHRTHSNLEECSSRH
jgi:hypothetical protein